jgi:hypothetical protein
MDLNPRSTTPDMTRLPNSVQVWTAPIISFAHLFVLSISVLQLINQFFHLCDRPAFKMNIYHKLKISYIIRYVIIKHALVKELLILQVQNDDIKP